MTTPPSHAELRGQSFPSVLGRGGVPPMYANHEEYEAALLSRAEAAERALGDLINDLSDPSHNDSHRVAVRSDHDVLVSLAQLAEEQLAALTALVARASVGESRSSASVKTSTRGVDLDVKSYADGLLDGAVTDAIEGYARGMRELAILQNNQWAQTVSDLAERKAGV